MMDSGYRPVYALSRGGHPESVHYGAIAVVDTTGRLLASFADPYQSSFLRSSAKPFQAMPFVLAGGVQHYGLTPAELALLCASHSGTDGHLAILHGLMHKCGLGEEALLCGTHPPYHAPTAERLLRQGDVPSAGRHNCSGKHTGMLAYTHMRGWPLESYIDVQHPLQQEILALFAEFAGLPTEDLAVGIDGCSAPNWAVPLYNTALAYARLADPSGLPAAQAAACQQITAAMQSHPDMVAGPQRFDTDLMSAAPGRIVSKLGAEGYQAFGLPAGVLAPDSPGVGIAIKIADGDARKWASHAVALEVLRQLGVLDAATLATLSVYGPLRPVTNWRGIQVGEAAPCFTLERA